MAMAQETEGSGYGQHVFEMDAESRRHPQGAYRDLRATAGTLHEKGSVLRRGSSGVVACTRHDVEEVLRHHEIFSSVGASDLENVRPLIPLQVDPPEHKKYRRILDPLFAPQRMNRLEERLVAHANSLIDSFAGRDEIDFSQEFSVPFPTQVLLTLLGLPLGDLPYLLSLKDGITRPHHIVGKGIDHPDSVAYRVATAPKIYEYFDVALDEKRRQPRDDLLSRMLDSEIDDRRLSHEEILDICFLLVLAGLDTVSGSLECFFAYLAENPGRRMQLVAEPRIVARAVEELLRWETTTPVVSRVATRDTELGGCPIAAGERVAVHLGSADTDEDDLADAYQVRWDRVVNRHLAFGGGVHRCLGSNLARLELRVALCEWHARIPDYRIKPGVELDVIMGQRAIETFPMLLGVSA